jgi:hypothetical protein
MLETKKVCFKKWVLNLQMFLEPGRQAVRKARKR